jgi:hypothetical protein
MDRRTYLAGLCAALAGCTARPSTGGHPTTARLQTPTESTQATRSKTDTKTETRTETDIPVQTAPVCTGRECPPIRGRGEPISIEHTVLDPPGYNDGKEYNATSGTVRYVAATSKGEPVKYETISFEKWATIQTAERGSTAAEKTTTARLDAGAGIDTGFTTAAADRLDPYVIVISLRTVLERDGEPMSTPAVEFPALVDEAPRSADVTISLDGDTFSRSVPVYAEAVTLQQL